MYLGLLIVIIIAMSFIYIGGAFLYKYGCKPLKERNPMYFAIGIAFAGGGGHILANIMQYLLLPNGIQNLIRKVRMGRYP